MRSNPHLSIVNNLPLSDEENMLLHINALCEKLKNHTLLNRHNG
ncbi:hypothetical protein HL670_03310 [Serratia plymuthica]|nr:hypothetical protein HL670_03310 [Serratia plymuthica]